MTYSLLTIEKRWMSRMVYEIRQMSGTYYDLMAQNIGLQTKTIDKTLIHRLDTNSEKIHLKVFKDLTISQSNSMSREELK